jgi:hypothetical protein
VSGVDDPDVEGTVARLQGDLLSIAITEAALFIGSGATLNEVAGSAGYGTVALPESNDPKAVGFSVSGGSLQLGIFTARDQAITGTTYTALTSTRKYTAVQGALGKAQLQGVDAVKLIGTSLVLQINRSSVASGGVLDWRQSSLSAAALSLSPSDPTFRIGGSVGLSIADLVYGSATISLAPGWLTQQPHVLGDALTIVEMLTPHGAADQQRKYQTQKRPIIEDGEVVGYRPPIREYSHDELDAQTVREWDGMAEIARKQGRTLEEDAAYRAACCNERRAKDIEAGLAPTVAPTKAEDLLPA